MKRKSVALCLLFIMLLSAFGGCSRESVFLTVEDRSISKGLFTYYLDKVISFPEEYGITAGDRQAAVDRALDCCKRYIASQRFMEDNSISLTTQNKQSVATEVETLWSLYASHYKEIGVTKPDITEALTHEYRLKQIVDYHYGPNGLEPIDEDDLKEEFVDLYVGFRAVTAPLTKTNNLGETVPLSESEKEALLNILRAYRTEINEGTKTIDEVNVAYNSSLDIIVTENLEINVVKIGDPMYDENFFNTLLEISHTRAGIIECGNTLYLVQREKIATTDDDEFYLYRTGLIEELKMGEIEEKINTLAAELDCDLDSDAAEDIYKRLYKEDKSVSSAKEKAMMPEEYAGFTHEAEETTE